MKRRKGIFEAQRHRGEGRVKSQTDWGDAATSQTEARREAQKGLSPRAPKGSTVQHLVGFWPSEL